MWHCLRQLLMLLPLLALVLPARWCCILPLGKPTPVHASTDHADCCCCDPSGKSAPSEETPPPDRCCCVELPASTPDRPIEPGPVANLVATLAPGDLTLRLQQISLHFLADSPCSSRPLHVLQCLWLC